MLNLTLNLTFAWLGIRFVTLFPTSIDVISTLEAWNILLPLSSGSWSFSQNLIKLLKGFKALYQNRNRMMKVESTLPAFAQARASSGILCFSLMLNVFLKLDSWQQVRQKLQVWHRNDWFWENKENQWVYYPLQEIENFKN